MSKLSALSVAIRSMVEERYADRIGDLVLGEGNVGAEVMMIGEAPGADEVMQGRPFVGKAGKNLNAFLESVRLKRSDMYVTNTVKLRPWKLSKSGNRVNRPPTRAEIQDFLPYLKQEIQLVAPTWIITLGNTPLQALLGNHVTIGNVHGTVITFEGCNVYPMYHPASMIYNPSLKTQYSFDIERFAALLREKRA